MVAPASCYPSLKMVSAAVTVALALTAPRAPAQAPAWQKDGLFITVPNPITDSAVRQIKSRIDEAFNRDQRSLRTIVFDFNPGGQPAVTSDFDSGSRLKRMIQELRKERGNLATIAFVHDEVTKHTVLPVLACHQIIMSKKGQLGAVMRGQAGEPPDDIKSAYEALARSWSGGSPDLILKMVDKNLVITQVKTKDGIRYVRKQHDQPGEVPPGLEAGDANTLFDSEKARKYGLCASSLYETRSELARALGLSPRSLREDTPPDDKTPVVWRIDLSGTVNKAKLDSLERRIKSAVGRGANVIILYLDCEGGETKDVASTAKTLSTLRNAAEDPYVRTIAYVPSKRSLGAATFLALGCSEIVMADDAVLGDFEYLRSAGEKLEPTALMLEDLADKQGYPPALFRATLTPDLVLYRAHRKLDRDVKTILTRKELDESPGWEEDGGENGTIAAPKGELLKVTAALAQEWGVARDTKVPTVEALYERYRWDPTRVRVSRDDWLDKIAEFFREDVVKVFLIMLGIAGLILELKMPGVGLPGVVAAICFVLFFWAHSFVGQFTMLAVFLFVLGLILIGLEIFVLPGFGVTGISGIVLVVGSLLLVTLERMPSSGQDWLNVGATITTLGVGLVAAIAGACVLAWYLPSIPYASRLVLAPPDHEDGVDRDAFGGKTETAAAALLGAIGVAATTLRPAGKARFGDDYLDVIAEGDYVNPGSRVQVIEIEGNRIVVKEV